MESNSIITEEDSAFEDNLSPKAGKKKLNVKQESREKLDDWPEKMRGLKAHHDITGNATYRDNEKYEVDYVP